MARNFQPIPDAKYESLHCFTILEKSDETFLRKWPLWKGLNSDELYRDLKADFIPDKPGKPFRPKFRPTYGA